MRSLRRGASWWRGIFLGLVLVCSVRAEDPVYFADTNLKAAVEDVLDVSNPTPSDMLTLTKLNVNYKLITDLTGLEYATNLTELEAFSNEISDISPLAGLTKLTLLDLYWNDVEDLSPVAGMTQLRTLYIEGCQVCDLSPLAGLSLLNYINADENLIEDISVLSNLHQLRYLEIDGNRIRDISVLAQMSQIMFLDLDGNKIQDISPLKDLRNLISLDLLGNPLNQEACSKYIPKIIQNNPGIDIAYDACEDTDQFTLTLAALEGGRVIDPGEGTVGPYSKSTTISMEAKPNQGYTFAGWSGSAVNAGKVRDVQSEKTTVTVDSSYTVIANFVTAEEIPDGQIFWYVDDNAPNDPAPGDLEMSDVLEDGSALHPFDSIQEAIDSSSDGNVIQVLPGMYYENIVIQGKAIEVRGMDPNDPNTGELPVLYGLGEAPAVRVTGSDADMGTTLKGMAVVGAKGPQLGAIECEGGSPVFVNCLVTGNYTSNDAGGSVYVMDCNLMMVNCTIADNTCGALGAGIVLENSQMLLTDSIVWANTPKGIVADMTSLPVSQFCDLQEPGIGQSNQQVDPLFASSGMWVYAPIPTLELPPTFPNTVWVPGDYHLKSVQGRWSSAEQTFVVDDVNSPCIDAGSETVPVGLEPEPNGDRLNQGVYGGTVFASMAYDVNDVNDNDDDPGEEPYTGLFKDENLKNAIMDKLWITWEPTEEDLRWVTSLNLRDCNISDLTGIEYAVHLQELNLRYNHITDVTPLQSLAELRTLNLSENEMSDLSGVATLSHLRTLDVHGNGVSDLSPLSTMTKLTSLTIRDNDFGGDLSALSSLINLEYLDAQENQVHSLSPLSGMTQLKTLCLYFNWISDVSVLGNLSQLEVLDLRFNGLVDISPLTRLTHLEKLSLENNALNSQALQDIQTIKHNNPGIDLTY